MFKKCLAMVWLSGALLITPTAYAQSSGSSISPPWRSTDVGAVGLAGNVEQTSSREWFISGAGRDIWGTEDSFFFVYQPIRDGVIGGTVNSQSATHPFAKTGVMIRQTLHPSSPEVILDVKPNGGIEFMTRSSAGGETRFVAGGSVPVGSEVNFNLVRSGSRVTGSFCLGTDCTDVGTVQFPLGEALAGIAVTSHDASMLNRAFFAGLPAVFAVPFPWGGIDIGPFGPAANPGHATYEEATGTFFVSGDGSDIWGPIDSFYTVARTFFGDSRLTARVLGEENTNPFAKAGLIMGDFGATSRRVILDVKPDGGIEFMARTSDSTDMQFIAGASATFPVWLRLTRRDGEFTGEISADATTWTTVGTATMTNPTTAMTGFAVTSHDPTVLNTARFDNVAFTTTGVSGQNLLVNAGFENSVIPNPAPGWVSDDFRQSPAVSEMAAPQSGRQNGACRTTSLDCGIYQQVVAPQTGSYGFSIYALTDHPGSLVGVNVNGTLAASRPVLVGGYQLYSMGFFANAGDVIHVWMYAPNMPGFVAIDDVTLTARTP